MVFRTEIEAEEYALSLRDAHRDEHGVIWARDPVARAMGRVYITRCIAFTRSGKRVAAFKVTIGA